MLVDVDLVDFDDELVVEDSEQLVSLDERFNDLRVTRPANLDGHFLVGFLVDGELDGGVCTFAQRLEQGVLLLEELVGELGFFDFIGNLLYLLQNDGVLTLSHGVLLGLALAFRTFAEHQLQGFFGVLVVFSLGSAR